FDPRFLHLANAGIHGIEMLLNGFDRDVVPTRARPGQIAVADLFDPGFGSDRPVFGLSGLAFRRRASLAALIQIELNVGPSQSRRYEIEFLPERVQLLLSLLIE